MKPKYCTAYIFSEDYAIEQSPAKLVGNFPNCAQNQQLVSSIRRSTSRGNYSAEFGLLSMTVLELGMPQAQVLQPLGVHKLQMIALHRGYLQELLNNLRGVRMFS